MEDYLRRRMRKDYGFDVLDEVDAPLYSSVIWQNDLGLIKVGDCLCRLVIAD